MSKARGNVVKPKAVIDKYGADALRWYLFTSSPPGNVRRFSEEMLADISRRFLSTMWNVYSFFVTYANIDNFIPSEDKAHSPASELDRWIISELNQLITDVDSSLDSYDPTGAGRRIETFVDRLSNWYVRRSRRRFWKSGNDADKISAYNVLYQCLLTLAKLLAPFMPFVAEAMYRNLVLSAFPGAPESVHLSDFPTADESKTDPHLERGTQLAMKVSSLGRAARSQAGIKVRQPLQKLLVTLGSASHQKSLRHLSEQVLEEVNVKEMEIVEEVLTSDWPVASEGEITVMIDPTITPDLEAEGLAREIVHRLQNMRRSAGFDIADHITTFYHGDEFTSRVMKEYEEYIRQETLSDVLSEGAPPEGAHAESFKLSGHQVSLGVQRR
jgi:isoleucyl-tRNA synthetase